MTKTRYYNYKREMTQEYVLRFLTKTVTMIAVIISILTVIVLIKTDRQLKELDTVNNYEIFTERIPVKEAVDNYIDSLPIPKEQYETIQNIKELEKTTVQEELNASTHKESIMYQESDVELLAHLMYAEEGIFIYKLSEEDAKRVSMLAGSVVIHRANSNYMGAENIKDVIYTPGQYDCVNRGTINQEVPEIVYEWAKELLENGPIGPENLVFQAEFEQGSETFEHIGNQYFCLK